MRIMLAVLLGSVAVAAAADLVIADFEGTNYGDWQVEGTAFGAGPAHGALAHQKPVGGFLGQGLINSYNGGDRSTGTLTSPAFVISRKFISFLIGGGGYAGKTCLNLLVDGKVVRTATGPHTTPGGSEDLTSASWNVAEFAGRKAQVQIVDNFSGTWGHITVDQIVLTDQDPAVTAAEGELLYNGIRLPAEWPPRHLVGDSREPLPVPYLDAPPAVLPIDVGRQLFVDDFLIEQTTLRRTFHHAQKYAGNPVLKPETPQESTGSFKEWQAAATACPFDDGVFFDPKDRLFKLWYMGGMCRNTMLATSSDGLHWTRPTLDVEPGSNVVIPWRREFARDAFSPWLDWQATDPAERWKAFLYARTLNPPDPKRHAASFLYTSPDGIHWQQYKNIKTTVGDNTTIFFNPFRNKWVMSVRNGMAQRGRARFYFETDSFAKLAAMKKDEPVFWSGADRLDPPDPKIKRPTQLYCLSPIAYESLMLGAFAIHQGPENGECDKGNFPKLVQLELGFSRDGFHFSRPDRTPFIAATQHEGDWDRGYLRPAGSVCTIVGDQLYFYYCGFSGVGPDGKKHMYAGGSTHVALLRRDGFASMDADEKSGTLTTRPLLFKGKFLFVNLAAPHGALCVEVLDEAGKVIAPFSVENCVSVAGDATRQRVTWNGAADLAALAGQPVRLRFSLTNGALYAFWITPDPRGASFGYVAAGGPEFSGPTDAP